MALFTNDKIMSIIMLVAIILITLMLESYSSNVRLEAFATAGKKKSSNAKSSNAKPSNTTPVNTTPVNTKPINTTPVNAVAKMNLLGGKN